MTSSGNVSAPQSLAVSFKSSGTVTVIDVAVGQQVTQGQILARVDPGRRRSVTPHGLRHTTATHLLAAATDMDAVRRVLGHADLSTLGRYRDELPGELEAAMRVHPLLRGSDA